jgi:putative transposase
VIGWSQWLEITRNVIIDALRMAWFKPHPSTQAELIFNSDPGNMPARITAMHSPSTASPRR